MGLTAAAAVGAALAFDAAFGEPPARVHPVALFGRAVGHVDRAWTRPRLVGAVAALSLPLAGGAVAGLFTELAVRQSRPLGGVVAALALFSATSRRLLLAVTSEVVELTARDVDEARESVRALVGRDATSLPPGELRSAAVESLAENLADGLVAPLFAFALGAQASLAAGVAAAVWVKAVNTMDSMLGYRSKPVGWASARLDDAVMWVPARVGAALVALAGRSLGALSLARAWHREPPSPNSGWPMATLAAVLDVELRKPGVYTLNPSAGLPTAERARVGVRVVWVAGLLSFLLSGVVAWL